MKQNDIDIEEGGGSSASPMQDESVATTTTSNSNRDDVLQPPSTIDIMIKKKQDNDNSNDEQPLISKIDSLISRFNRPTAASSIIKPPMTYKSSFSTANIAKVDSVSPPSSNALSESSTNDTSSPSTATSPDEATDTDTNHDKSIISTSTTPTTNQIAEPVITDQTNEQLTPQPQSDVVANDNIVNDKDSTTIANSIYDGKDGSTIEISQVKELSDQNTSSPGVAADDDTSNHHDQKDISTPITKVESSQTTEQTENDIETGVKQDISNDDLEEGDKNQITSLGDIESQTEENSSNSTEEVVENSEVKESAAVEEAKALETNSVDDDEATPIVKEPLILPWWKQRRTKISVGVFIILLGVLALALGISLSASSSSATTTALVTTSSPSVSIIPTVHPSSLSSQDDLTSSLPTQSSIDTSLAPSTSTPSTTAPITSPSLSPTTLQPTDKPVTSSPSKKPTTKPITSKPTSLSPTSNPVSSSSTTLASPLDFDDQEEEGEQSSSLCKDTPNYLDMYGGTCEDYSLDENEAWCGGYGNDGKVGETPNENCCVCKQQAITITDTEEEEVVQLEEETTDIATTTATTTDDEDLDPNSDDDQDVITKWLEAHNSRRKKWHENGGKEYNALKWSDSLSQASQIWADHLLESGCEDFTLAHGKICMLLYLCIYHYSCSLLFYAHHQIWRIYMEKIWLLLSMMALG